MRHLVIAAIVMLSQVSFAADKMDLETHSLLITKLERVLERGKTPDASDVEVRLRLADLLAERARLHVVEAEGKDSAAVQSDRRRALNHYQIAVDKTNAQRRALVLLQMAHLNETLGQPAKAIELLSRIVREGTKVYPANSVGHAYSNWGDILFLQGEFAKALEKFEAALPLVENGRKGYVIYKIAWSQLNLGRIEVATNRLIQLLRTPELFVDEAFHEDVARDLVSFIARGEVTTQRVNLLLELTPPAIQRENLKSLALETERLGKKREAIYVWNMILDQEASVAERVDGRIRLATLEWSLNRKQQAVDQLTEAAAIWKKDGCGKKDECESAQGKMRKLIVDWNRLEKEQVSKELFAAYTIYLEVHTNEYDMHLWAAQVARILKKYAEASELYRKSSILAHKDLAKKEDAEKRKHFEAALVAQIEMAEQSNKPASKEAAYDHYLKLNPKGDRAFEVRYQRARLYYEQNQIQKALNEFYAVAMTDTKSQVDLRKKAADLHLDALVLAKQESKIEATATEFAKVIPAGRKEYINIARRAALKEIGTTSNNPKASESDLKSASKRLVAVNLEGASEDERKMIFKNQVILAVRTRDLEGTDRATDRLLSIRGLSDSDREFALEKKVWAAEMRLDFAKAYALTQKMEMSKVAEADRELRLAYLAELAGRNSTRHYEKVISSAKQKSKAILAATRLVRLSSNPWAALEKYSGLLRQNREAFASLVLEAYGRTNNVAKTQKYLEQSTVRRTNAGLTLSHIFESREINAFDKKIASHRMVTASDRLIQESLKKRLALLNEAEALAQKSIRAKDWTLQVLTLTIAARENQRLFEEIAKLPIPRRLDPVQKDAYTRAIAARAAPFEAKAKEINKKLADFWNNDDVIDSMLKGLEDSRRPAARVYANELRELARRAPTSTRSRIEKAVARVETERPSDNDVLSARRALSRDPFSVSAAKELKRIEAELDRDAMVAYLDARLGQLEGGPL